MGGVCSVALGWQAPTVFGLAASLSGAFQVERRTFLLRILRRYHGRPKALRVYLDSGTTDYSGGDDGRVATITLRDGLVEKGWVLGADLQHVIGQGHSHSEDYWRARLPGALRWLFPP